MSSNRFTQIQETDRRLTARLQLGDEDKIERRLVGLAAHSGDSWFILLGLGLIWLIGDTAWHALAIQTIIAILVLAIFVVSLNLPSAENAQKGIGVKYIGRRIRTPFPLVTPLEQLFSWCSLLDQDHPGWACLYLCGRSRSHYPVSPWGSTSCQM